MDSPLTSSPNVSAFLTPVIGIVVPQASLSAPHRADEPREKVLFYTSNDGQARCTNLGENVLVPGPPHAVHVGVRLADAFGFFPPAQITQEIPPPHMEFIIQVGLRPVPLRRLCTDLNIRKQWPGCRQTKPYKFPWRPRCGGKVVAHGVAKMVKEFYEVRRRSDSHVAFD